MTLYHVYPNVSLGDHCTIGAFASVGLPPRGYQEGELATVVGNDVDIQTHATLCAGNIIGNDVVIGHGLYMRHSNHIGSRVVIGPHSVLEWEATIGDDVTIGTYAGISEYAVIEQGSWLGPQVSLPSVLHPLCPKAKECGRGPHLERGVTVGGCATIYPDLRIGCGAWIQPCAVVIADVVPFAVMAGNPAKQIGDIFSLAPEIVDRIRPYIDLSESATTQIIKEFTQQPSLFAAKR